MIMNKKQLKRANETLDKLNKAIKGNEEDIVEITKNIRKAKNNNNYKTVIKLEKIRTKMKANTKKLRESKKELMFIIADFDEIDKVTKNTVSNIPLTKEYLKANYRVSNTFNGVSLNSINDNLPHKLSSKRLSKLIHECFPNVKARKCTNDIKYNMEMIL